MSSLRARLAKYLPPKGTVSDANGSAGGDPAPDCQQSLPPAPAAPAPPTLPPVASGPSIPKTSSVAHSQAAPKPGSLAERMARLKASTATSAAQHQALLAQAQASNYLPTATTTNTVNAAVATFNVTGEALPAGPSWDKRFRPIDGLPASAKTQQPPTALHTAQAAAKAAHKQRDPSTFSPTDLIDRSIARATVVLPPTSPGKDDFWSYDPLQEQQLAQQAKQQGRKKLQGSKQQRQLAASGIEADLDDDELDGGPFDRDVDNANDDDPDLDLLDLDLKEAGGGKKGGRQAKKGGTATAPRKRTGNPKTTTAARGGGNGNGRKRKTPEPESKAKESKAKPKTNLATVDFDHLLGLVVEPAPQPPAGPAAPAPPSRAASRTFLPPAAPAVTRPAPPPDAIHEDFIVRMMEDGSDAPSDAEEFYLELAVPATINVFLRPYQRQGVRFLLRQYAQGIGGLLSDDMGLGKTIQAIGFCAAVLGKTGGPEDAVHDVNAPRIARIEPPIPDTYVSLLPLLCVF